MFDKDKDIIDMEVHYDSKWDKFKHKVNRRKERFKNWVKEDPRRALMIGSVGVVGAKKVADAVKALKPTQAELDRKWQDLHVYDHSLGCHYDLKRKMTNNEKLELARRKERGEKTGDILRDMKLLKR